MHISDNIIKELLKNVYFLSGGAYGGKTTMAKLLEQKYGLFRYRQGDNYDKFTAIATQEFQPTISFDRSIDWHGYFSQEPSQYAKWLDLGLKEETEFVIMDLIKTSQNQKVIADVIIPIDILIRIADYSQVILLFAPEEMTRKHYFDRADKDDVLQFILSFPDGEELLKNVIEGLHYNYETKRNEYINSGFKYIERTSNDTIENTLKMIEEHFNLSQTMELNTEDK